MIQVCLDSFVVGQIIHYRALERNLKKKDQSKQKTPIKILRDKYKEEMGIEDEQTSSMQLDSSNEDSAHIIKDKYNIHIEDLSQNETIQNSEEGSPADQREEIYDSD